MNRTKKNIVVVTGNFTEAEINSLALPDTKYEDESFSTGKITYVKDIKDAKGYQGYLLLINNSKNEKIVDLDKKYRKLFNKFERIWLYNEKHRWTVKSEEYGKYTYEWSNIDKWNRIEKVGRVIFGDYSDNMTDDWFEYKIKIEKSPKKVIKYNINKKERLDILYNYLKNYKTRKTVDIVKDLNISVRTLERYMMDLNNIYKAIGYDYTKNEWYFIW